MATLKKQKNTIEGKFIKKYWVGLACMRCCFCCCLTYSAPKAYITVRLESTIILSGSMVRAWRAVKNVQWHCILLVASPESVFDNLRLNFVKRAWWEPKWFQKVGARFQKSYLTSSKRLPYTSGLKLIGTYWRILWFYVSRAYVVWNHIFDRFVNAMHQDDNYKGVFHISWAVLRLYLSKHFWIHHWCVVIDSTFHVRAEG